MGKWEQLGKLRSSLQSHRGAPYLGGSIDRIDARYWQLRQAVSSGWGWSLLPWERRMLEERIDLCIGWANLLLRRADREVESVRSRQKEALDSMEQRLAEASTRRLDPELRSLVTRAQLRLNEARRHWEEQSFAQVDSLNGPLMDLYEAIESHLLTSEERFSDPVLRQLWDEWAGETIRASATSRSAILIIDKQRRLLHVYRSGRLFATYPVDLGRNPVADKLHEGDGATPEGRYKVARVKGQGSTRYFRALLLDYPNQRDRQNFLEARRNGSIQPDVSIGDSIEIHGEGGRGRDWTDGCVALSNGHMEELFRISYPGMPVAVVGVFFD